MFHHLIFYFLSLFLFICLALFMTIGSHSVYMGIIDLLLTLFIEQVWPFHSFCITPIDLFLALSYLQVCFLSATGFYSVCTISIGLLLVSPSVQLQLISEPQDPFHFTWLPLLCSSPHPTYNYDFFLEPQYSSHFIPFSLVCSKLHTVYQRSPLQGPGFHSYYVTPFDLLLVSFYQYLRHFSEQRGLIYFTLLIFGSFSLNSCLLSPCH
jgi:hypothetical protein